MFIHVKGKLILKHPRSAIIARSRSLAPSFGPGPNAALPGALALGGAGAAPHAEAEHAARQPKVKAPNFSKKIGSKATTLSSKLTDLRCLTTQVDTSTIL